MFRRQVLIAPLVLAASTLAVSADPGALTLLMFEQPGCSHCAAWHAEVGPEYPKTAEGIAAPVQRQQLRDGAPAGVTSNPVFTPTFVLLRDGQELSRIEGYPGENFFWGLLGQMLRKAELSAN
jgi:hypothetical protein